MKWTSVDEVIEKNCMEIFAPAEIAEKEDVSLQEQIQTIEQAELPEFFKQILLENNNREIYGILGAERFADYISSYITRTVINVIAFFTTFVFLTIVVRMTLFKMCIRDRFTATAGGGAVEVTVSGTREVLKVKLQEEVVDPDDIEMLEDLIVAATNEALRKVEAESASAMSKLTGGLGGGMPGLPF